MRSKTKPEFAVKAFLKLFKNELVDAAYEGILGRPADHEGRVAHADLLDRTGNLAEVLRLLSHSDELAGNRRVLIAVLASARKLLPAQVRSAGIGEHLLLVADECHRVGAPEMSAVLETPRAYSLGLSATPERDDDASDHYALLVAPAVRAGR